MKQSGFTLIEIVIVILILSIVVPGVVGGLRTMVVQSNRAEAMTVATDLARYYMELALSKRFDETPAPFCNGGCPQPVWSATLGSDAGEAGIGAFDDVDDFHNYSQNPITIGSDTFSGYSVTMNVAYMTVDASAGVEDGVWGTATSAGATNAKRVRVVVTHALIGDVTLNCITGAIY